MRGSVRGVPGDWHSYRNAARKMDIAINRNIEYGELKSFLEGQFPDLDVFLIYEGLNDCLDVEGEIYIFEYSHDKDIEDGFKSGLGVYVENSNVLPLIERLSSQISSHFACSTFCDASRIVLKEKNYYYSLLFERGRVYLVDDLGYEDTGNITKVVELVYEHPKLYSLA